MLRTFVGISHLRDWSLSPDSRPDMTSAVDWALKAKFIIYLSRLARVNIERCAFQATGIFHFTPIASMKCATFFTFFY